MGLDSKRQSEESLSSERPAVFLSCLGTSAYRELNYAGYEGEPGDPRAFTSRFVQHARLEALRHRGVSLERIAILVTGDPTGSRVRNWLDWEPNPEGQAHEHRPTDDQPRKGLETNLKEAGFAEVEAPEVPLGSNESEMWEIFNRVSDLVPDQAEIYVDLTHGFRTLPVLVLLALEYVEKVKGARVVELTYGADRLREDGLAPTWNLAPFLVVREWADAVEGFLRYGDTRPLADCAGKPLRDLKRQLKRDMPGELYQLGPALQDFGEAIQKCFSPGVLGAGIKLRKILVAAGQQSAVHDSLKPLAVLLHRVEKKLERFPQSEEDPSAALRAQWAAAHWCAEHGLAVQCLTFLREGFVRAFDLVLEQRQDLEIKGEGLVGLLSRNPGENENDESAMKILKQLEHQPIVSIHVLDGLKRNLGVLTTLRNKLNHAYYGHEDKAPVSDGELKKRADTFLELFQQMITDVETSFRLPDEVASAGQL